MRHNFMWQIQKKKTVDDVVNRGGPKPNPLKNLLSFLNPLSYFQMLNNPETRKRLTGYETQAEYEQARQNRINLNRIKTIENTLARKYSDGDYSQTDLDERLAALKSQMGITPNTAAQNEQQFLDFSNDPELAFEGIKSIPTGRTDYTDLQELYDRDKLLSGINTSVSSPAQTGLMSLNPNAGITFAGTVLEDEFTPALKNTGFIEVQDTPQSRDDFFLNAMADATTFPTDDGSGISLMKRSILRNAGYNDSQIREAQEDGYLDQLVRDIEGPIGIT